MGRYLRFSAIGTALLAALTAQAVRGSQAWGRPGPAAFVEHRGQWSPPARYLLTGAREAARIEDGAFSVALRRGGEGVVVRFAFEDASPGAIVEGEGLTEVGGRDAFLTVLDPRKTGPDQLAYSTYLGGVSLELPTALALGADSKVIVAGNTTSNDFGPDGAWHGSRDVFVVALDVVPPQADFTITGPDALGRVTVDASLSKAIPGTAITGYSWDFEDGSTAAGVRAEHVYAIPGRFAVRLAVTSDRGPAGTKVSAPFVVLPPPCAAAPWSCADVGDGSLRGSARGGGPDCLEVFASGAGIKETADGFQFVYRTLEGDGTLTARIPADGTDPRAPRAGVMLREGLEPAARHATMLLAQSDQGSRPFFLNRARAGGPTSSKPNPRALSQVEAWIRIERQGDVFAGSYSLDGKVSTELGRVSLPGLPSRLLAGLAAPASDAGEVPFSLPQTTFCEIAISGNVGGPAFLRGDADASGERDITDAIATLDHLFAGGPAPSSQQGIDPPSLLTSAFPLPTSALMISPCPRSSLASSVASAITCPRR